jgi:hypothetical protein
MPSSQKKAMTDIVSCRTPALGGQVYYCKNCREEHYSYHSCKSRFCPKCQNGQTSEWLNRQSELLLMKAPYFLVTFTLPSQLRNLMRKHQRILYSLFMRVAAQSMLQLAKNPRYLGGLVGIISVLQTWTRDLRYHPHVHMIVSGTGLQPNNQALARLKHRYLVPHKALAKLVAGKFRAGLAKQNLLSSVPFDVWKQPWVIDILCVDSGFLALRYLAPYVFRVAISNRRILSLQNGNVTFQFKNPKSKTFQKVQLPAEQFIARFLQHVLPHRFIKVRTYGLFHPGKKHLLQTAKLLAGTSDPPPSDPLPISHYPDHILCPKCKQPMERIATLTRQPSGIRSP